MKKQRGTCGRSKAIRLQTQLRAQLDQELGEALGQMAEAGPAPPTLTRPLDPRTLQGRATNPDGHVGRSLLPAPCGRTSLEQLLADVRSKFSDEEYAATDAENPRRAHLGEIWEPRVADPRRAQRSRVTVRAVFDDGGYRKVRYRTAWRHLKSMPEREFCAVFRLVG